MNDITYLMEKSKMSYEEVLNLPYGIFLSLTEQFIVRDLMKTEEGREMLDKISRFKNPRRHADLDAIRSFGRYKVESKGGEN